MNCKIVIILLIITSFSLNAKSQVKGVIKTSVVNLLQNKFSIAYEQRIDGKSSWLVEPAYQFLSTENDKEFELKRTWQLSGEYRKFIGSIMRDAPKKFYYGFTLSGFVQNIQTNVFEEPEIVDYDYFSTSLGMIVGNQYLILDKFAIDVFANPAYKITKNITDKTISADYEFDLSRVGVSFGICF